MGHHHNDKRYVNKVNLNKVNVKANVNKVNAKVNVKKVNDKVNIYLVKTPTVIVWIPRGKGGISTSHSPGKYAEEIKLHA